MLVFFICFAVTIALLLLGGWHVYLVTVAETSIEVHVNRKAHKESGVSRLCVCVLFEIKVFYLMQKFMNLYNHGYIHNWKMFLGLVNGR